MELCEQAAVEQDPQKLMELVAIAYWRRRKGELASFRLRILKAQIVIDADH
jgi:hypothetical protein